MQLIDFQKNLRAPLLQCLGIVLILALSGCSTAGGYKKLPERFIAVPESEDFESAFVFELRGFRDEPAGERFEFWLEGGTIVGRKTFYDLRSAPHSVTLSKDEALRFHDALIAFDWNHVEDLRDPSVVKMVLDDVSVLFRARIGPVFHEAQVGLSSSKSLRDLMATLGVLR